MTITLPAEWFASTSSALTIYGEVTHTRTTSKAKMRTQSIIIALWRDFSHARTFQDKLTIHQQILEHEAQLALLSHIS